MKSSQNDAQFGGCPPTLIDLFAGAGGGSIGFAQSGFLPVGAVEIEPTAAASYCANVRVVPVVDDIRRVKGSDLLAAAGIGERKLTLLFGCPPCQSFTVLRRGSACTPIDAARNSLPQEYLRLVRELAPRFLAFENVPGMAEGRWASALEQMLAGLAELGYETRWHIFDAAEFGVPQRRRRLLLVAGRDGAPRLPRRRIPTATLKSRFALRSVVCRFWSQGRTIRATPCTGRGGTQNWCWSA